MCEDSLILLKKQQTIFKFESGRIMRIIIFILKLDNCEKEQSKDLMGRKCMPNYGKVI